MNTAFSRTEGPGGYVVTRTVIIPRGLDELTVLRGEDHYQYITADGLEAVGSQHTLRVTLLNGVMVTDPEQARALWAEAGWL